MDGSLADRLTSYDATSLAEAIRARSLSCEDVISAHFERISKLNKECNALATLDQARALQDARAADTDLRKGRSRGPLHGVPITIKDALLTAGLRTTAGHSKYKDFVPVADAWVVDKLKKAGAIVIGKTNCAALCSDIQTRNDIFGTTTNPWDSDRTSGGSSGGDAAAVALGMSPLSIGSDTSGSIRVPSSYCGVFGLKTSADRIPRDGLLPLHDATHARPDSLTVVGPMARSIRDLALCHEILTGESLPIHTGASPKIYWTHRFDTQAVDDEVGGALDATFSALCNAGAEVAKVEPPFAMEKLFGTFIRLFMFEFCPEEIAGKMMSVFFLSEAVRSLFRGGVRGSYEALKRDQAALRRRMDVFMRGCDGWVLPATPSVAFAHQKTGRAIPMTLNGHTKHRGYWEASVGLTYPFNLLGNPCVVVPMGRSKEGMPIAVQVVGRVGEDRKLLGVAAYIAETIRARAGSSVRAPRNQLLNSGTMGGG
ncbi:amidase [Pendulispora brunnea]|uniref:Amidase n=1 Tax=Pendulispora brunnea TaxID=2905690 RepID=A0ABZ2KME5_9BACT